jgi:hypothetical protein
MGEVLTTHGMALKEKAKAAGKKTKNSEDPKSVRRISGDGLKSPWSACVEMEVFA